MEPYERDYGEEGSDFSVVGGSRSFTWGSFIQNVGKRREM
jgi:hypothetical protein